MDARSLTFAVVALCLGWSTGQTQAAALVAEAREAAQLAPAQALGLLRQALAIDTNQFEANWRAAVAAVGSASGVRVSDGSEPGLIYSSGAVGQRAVLPR